MKPQINKESIKMFFKRFWWIILLLILVIASLYVIFINLKKNNSESSDKNGVRKTIGIERIVASFTPESKTAFNYNSPTIVNDALYIGTSTKVKPSGSNPEESVNSIPNNYFYKFDLDLNVIWKYDLKNVMANGGATLDSKGNIYFVTIEFFVDEVSVYNQSGFKTILKLVSLTNNGELRWAKQISNGYERWEHAMINCGIGTDDTIYVGDSKLFAFDTEGNIKWQYPREKLYYIGLRTSPIIDDKGNIFFLVTSPTTKKDYGADEIKLYKFSPTSNGIPTWSSIMDNNILESEGGTNNGGGGRENGMYSSPSFSIGYKYVYAAVGNTINKVDASTGKVAWSIKPEGASGTFKESPAIDGYDNVYIGSKSNADSKLYAIKADGTGLIWKRDMGADMYPSPLLGDDNKLYIGSEQTPEGSFHAIDMKNGNTIWSIGGESTVQDISFGSPILYKGYAYFGISEVGDGIAGIYKVKADAYDYLPNAAWPRFHGGNDNTGRLGIN